MTILPGITFCTRTWSQYRTLKPLHVSNPASQSLKKNENLWFSILSIIFFLSIWSVIIFLKLHFDAPHYQTVDGDYYFLLAEKIRNGQDFVIEGIKNIAGKPFSPYPPGYPLLLCAAIAFEKFFQISAVLFLHSLLLFMLGFVWIIKKLPTFSLITICFTDTFMELACNQWSEFSFIIFLILIGIWISGLEFKNKPQFPLVFSAIFFSVFLIRYAGVFLAVFIVLKLWQNFKQKAHFRFWILTGFGFGSLVLLWFIIEIFVYGQATGGDRYANGQTASRLAFDLMIGLFDQIFLLKDWSGSSVPSFGLSLFFIGLFLIWALIFSTAKTINYEKEDSINMLTGNNLIYIGIVYFSFIIPLRWYFYFAEGFDLRLLGPGAILVLLGCSIRFFDRFEIRKKMLFICLWVLVSSFFSLPKKAMYLKFQEGIWGNTSTIFPQSSQ